jgi:hypothetical protein
MRRVVGLLSFTVVATLPFGGFTLAESFPVLQGPYLGQTPPGATPEVFAPGVVSTGDGEGCYGFMDGGRLFVFKHSPPGSDWKWVPLSLMALEDGRWSKPSTTTLDELYPYNFTVSPDGTTLYFSSVHAPEDRNQLLPKANIWVVRRGPEGWATPRMLPFPINTDGPDAYPTVTRDGTLYFMSVREGGFGTDDVYRSRLKNGQYAELEHLGAPVNTEYSEVDVFIAPDESYLIFCSDRPGGYARFDLYVTFRKDDDSWSPPVNMGREINAAGYQFRPSVTPDGKYFFYTRGEPDGEDALYWVSAQIIRDLRPEGSK